MMNRKASTQLKLPITMNRQVTSRPRSDSTDAKKNEKSSTRPSLLSDKLNQNEIKSESPLILHKQPNETKENIKELKDSPEQKITELKREKSMNRTELKKSKSEVKRELNDILSEDKMKIMKERKMKEKLEKEKKEKEEKELEEKRLQYLEEEHRRWKFKDKIDSTSGNGKKRTLCGRLFLQVGESSEFDEKDEKLENEEEIKVIQGTLAAELLELIEKTRGVKPVEIQRQNSNSSEIDKKDDKNKIITPSSRSNSQQIEKNESKNLNNISSTNIKQDKKHDTDSDHDSDSSFDEEEYFREVAALSFDTEGDDITSSNTSQGIGKGPLALVGRLPDSLKVKGSSLSKEAAKTIAKAKKRVKQNISTYIILYHLT